MRRDVYSGYLKLLGEHGNTLIAANNYAYALLDLRRAKEAKPLMRKMIPVAQRALGKGNETTLRISWHYARALCEDIGATLDDLREAATTLEETTQTARRVPGGAHPLTEVIAGSLRNARSALRARETPST